MCYRYEYKSKPDLFLFQQLANTPKLLGVIYELKPGKLFESYKYSKFIKHTQGVYPAHAIRFAPVMSRGDHRQENSINAAIYLVTCFKLLKKRLPPPRVTNCQDYNKTMGETCKQV